MRSIRTLFVFSSFLTLMACSTLPPDLSASGQPVLSQFSQLTADQGKTTDWVRLGGVIAAIKNYQDRTRLEVVNLPIGPDGKPDINDEPNGRFFVYVDVFLDPVTYHHGRLITVLGKAAGMEHAASSLQPALLHRQLLV